MLFTTNDLHRQFRSVIELLTLVSALNHGGHPRFQVQYPEDTLQPRNSLLNALNSLLVRNHDSEVIATAINTSNQVPSESDKPHELYSSESLPNDGPEFHEPEPSELLPNHPPGIIAINYSVLEKGTSHIRDRFGDWDVLFRIP